MTVADAPERPQVSASRDLGALKVPVALLLVGGLIVGIGVYKDFVFVTALGATAMVVALGLLRGWVGAVQKKRVAVATVSGGVIVLVGLGSIWLALEGDRQWLAVVGVMVVVLGALPLMGAVHAVRLRSRAWALAGLGLIAVGPILMVRTNAWLGIVLLVVGLVAFKASLRSMARPTDWTAKAGPVAVLVGTGLVLIASYTVSPLIAAIGTYLLVVGMMSAGTTWEPGYDHWRNGKLYLLGGGAAAIVLGLLLAFREPTLGRQATATLVILLLAWGASFVLRGESVVLLVLAGIAVMWVATDRVYEGSPDPNPSAASRIVAIGDSYMSGEGAPTFYKGTNNKGTGGDQCRRSPTAYPVLVAKRLDMGLDFLACSGADTIDLDKDGSRDQESPNDIVAQLQQAERLDKTKVRIVLVSIGGNDALFGQIGRVCLFPGSCDELREIWLANIDQIGARIAASQKSIREAFPRASIVVVPYPLVVDANACDWSGLKPAEHEFLREFTAVLADRIRVSAANAGVRLFEEGLFAFKEAEICDGDGPNASATNLINVNPVQGSITSRLNPTNWFHGSLHPKPDGHERVANLLVPFLRSLLADGHLNPEPTSNASFELRGLRGAARELFDPTELPEGFAGEAGCESPTKFATRARVVDSRAFIPLDANPNSVVCLTTADGSWSKSTPVTPADGIEPDPARPALILGGVVKVRPPRPESSYRQFVLYRDLRNDWRLLLVDFCDLDPLCQTGDVERWRDEQIAAAARTAGFPAVLLLVGGWIVTFVVAKWTRGRRLLGGTASTVMPVPPGGAGT